MQGFSQDTLGYAPTGRWHQTVSSWAEANIPSRLVNHGIAVGLDRGSQSLSFVVRLALPHHRIGSTPQSPSAAVAVGGVACLSATAVFLTGSMNEVLVTCDGLPSIGSTLPNYVADVSGSPGYKLAHAEIILENSGLIDQADTGYAAPVSLKCPWCVMFASPAGHDNDMDPRSDCSPGPAGHPNFGSHRHVVRLPSWPTMDPRNFDMNSMPPVHALVSGSSSSGSLFGPALDLLEVAGDSSSIGDSCESSGGGALAALPVPDTYLAFASPR